MDEEEPKSSPKGSFIVGITCFGIILVICVPLAALFRAVAGFGKPSESSLLAILMRLLGVPETFDPAYFPFATLFFTVAFVAMAYGMLEATGIASFVWNEVHLDV